MAVPTYIFSDTLETGSQSITDSGSQAIVAHYASGLASVTAPYQGAYAMWVKMRSGVTNPVLLSASNAQRQGDLRFYRWNMWVGDDIFDSTGNCNVVIWGLWTLAPLATVYTVGMIVDVSNRQVSWALGTTTPNSIAGGTVPINEWFCVELYAFWSFLPDGFIELYVTRDGYEPSATSKPIHGIYGQTNPADAGSIQTLGLFSKPTEAKGTIVYNDYIIDNARIWPIKDRYSDTKVFVRNEHAFVGAGTVSGFSLASSAAADNVVTLYDTDTAQTHQSLKRATLANIVSNETKTYEGPPIHFTRGCYVQITGTSNPEVTIQIDRSPGWYSSGNIRRHAHARHLQP